MIKFWWSWRTSSKQYTDFCMLKFLARNHFLQSEVSVESQERISHSTLALMLIFMTGYPWFLGIRSRICKKVVGQSERCLQMCGPGWLDHQLASLTFHCLLSSTMFTWEFVPDQHSKEYWKSLSLFSSLVPARKKTKVNVYNSLTEAYLQRLS